MIFPFYSARYVGVERGICCDRRKKQRDHTFRCNLRLKEKLLIIRRPELSSLNKRNELVSSCRHRNKTFLRSNWSIIFMQIYKVYERWYEYSQQ